jgi:hypothetical protein
MGVKPLKQKKQHTVRWSSFFGCGEAVVRDLPALQQVRVRASGAHDIPTHHERMKCVQQLSAL